MLAVFWKNQEMSGTHQYTWGKKINWYSWCLWCPHNFLVFSWLWILNFCWQYSDITKKCQEYINKLRKKEKLIFLKPILDIKTKTCWSSWKGTKVLVTFPGFFKTLPAQMWVHHQEIPPKNEGAPEFWCPGTRTLVPFPAENRFFVLISRMGIRNINFSFFLSVFICSWHFLVLLEHCQHKFENTIKKTPKKMWGHQSSGAPYVSDCWLKKELAAGIFILANYPQRLLFYHPQSTWRGQIYMMMKMKDNNNENNADDFDCLQRRQRGRAGQQLTLEVRTAMC